MSGIFLKVPQKFSLTPKISASDQFFSFSLRKFFHEKKKNLIFGSQPEGSPYGRNPWRRRGPTFCALSILCLRLSRRQRHRALFQKDENPGIRIIKIFLRKLRFTPSDFDSAIAKEKLQLNLGEKAYSNFWGHLQLFTLNLLKYISKR